ncbi:MAG TPA: hypothetical protein DCM32_09710 [Xanthomonadaceae bacterium]|nr:hypothetical protein [Xanthomonadaceae bacterium]
MSGPVSRRAGQSSASTATTARRRWWWRAGLALLAPLLLLLIAVLSAPWWFDARRVATLALTRVDAATGLDWSFAGEPELRWRPQPWLALPGLTVRDAEGRTLVHAERLELALPWSTLRGETRRIEAIAITAPIIDLEAALAWWNAQPPGDGTLPVLDGLTLAGGRVLWAGGRVDDIQLDLTRFAVGEPMRLEASGRVRLLPSLRAPFEVALRIDATPQAAPLRLESVGLALSGSGPVPRATAGGRLQFDPWQLALEGEIAAWPEAWPALPPALAAGTAPLAFSLSQSGHTALAAATSIRLRREGAEAEARLVPADLLAWHADDAASPLPPVRGRATAPRVVIDGVILEGVSIELGEREHPAGTRATGGAAHGDSR